MTTDRSLYIIKASVHGCRFQLRLNGGILMAGSDSSGGSMTRAINQWITPGKNHLTIQTQQLPLFGPDEHGSYRVEILACDLNDPLHREYPIIMLRSDIGTRGPVLDFMERPSAVTFEVPDSFPAPSWTSAAELPSSPDFEVPTEVLQRLRFLSTCVESGRQDLYLRLSEYRNAELAAAYFESLPERVAQTAKETRSLFSGDFQPIAVQPQDTICELLSGNRILRVATSESLPWLRFRHRAKPIFAKVDTYWCRHSGQWTWVR